MAAASGSCSSIRYELEKAFLNGAITVDEIPALWNAKYREVLGVGVPDDTQGCLQDVLRARQRLRRADPAHDEAGL